MNTIRNDFMKIYSLTLKCLPEGQGLKDINPSTMWSDLADLWQTNEGNMGFSVFVAVWHLIFWGIYPENVESDTAKQLVAAVRNQSLVIGEAMLAWSDRDDYADAWDTITSSTRSQLTRGPSIHMDIHNRFLQKRAYLKEHRDLYECQTESSSPDINFIKEYSEKVSWCADYQEIVAALIPKAKKWSYADWGDDRKILRQLSGDNSYSYMRCYDESQMDEEDYELQRSLLPSVTVDEDNIRSIRKQLCSYIYNNQDPDGYLVASRVMRKIVCRLRPNEVSRQ